MSSRDRAALGAVLLASSVAFAQPAPPEAARSADELDPFTFADFTWQSGNARTKDSVLGNQYVTGELRLDDVFHYSLNRPKDAAGWQSGRARLSGDESRWHAVDTGSGPPRAAVHARDAHQAVTSLSIG
jgi:hypothetical protein